MKNKNFISNVSSRNNHFINTRNDSVGQNKFFKSIKDSFSSKNKLLTNIIASVKSDNEIRTLSRDNVRRAALSLSPKRNRMGENKSLLPQNPKLGDKKTIVLDLDETLVHSTFDFLENPDLVIPIKVDEESYDVNVLIRPYAFEFLEELSKFFEVVIFTASISQYADPLVSQIDFNKRCKHRLFREHCTYLDGAYLKDMSKLGRELRNIIIVDNSPISYSLQESNGIPVKSWYEDREDNELMKLLPILQNLSAFYDVRSEIPKFVTGNTLIWIKAFKWLQENYILCALTNEIEDPSIRMITDINQSIVSLNSEDNIVESTQNILNNPNININIINGDYNRIVYTEGNEVNNHDEYVDLRYQRVHTEENVVTQTILDENIAILNKTASDLKRKVRKTPIYYNLLSRHRETTKETSNKENTEYEYKPAFTENYTIKHDIHGQNSTHTIKTVAAGSKNNLNKTSSKPQLKTINTTKSTMKSLNRKSLDFNLVKKEYINYMPIESFNLKKTNSGYNNIIHNIRTKDYTKFLNKSSSKFYEKKESKSKEKTTPSVNNIKSNSSNQPTVNNFVKINPKLLEVKRLYSNINNITKQFQLLKEKSKISPSIQNTAVKKPLLTSQIQNFLKTNTTDKKTSTKFLPINRILSNSKNNISKDTTPEEKMANLKYLSRVKK